MQRSSTATTPRRILFTKRDEWSGHAAKLGRAILGASLEIRSGANGDPFPGDLPEGRIDSIISFVSPWIVPPALLERAALAINFHPGSRDYPGIGCYNFALYEEAAEFGAVCHHMAAAVDTGPIIAERRFPVLAGETVESLKLRTMAVMLALYHEVLTAIAAEKPLVAAGVTWSRRPFLRRELNALARITPDMPADEIRRRVRAMTYPGFPGPQVELGGVVFRADVPDRDPLA
jgi:methionyl-tRNA formyltransferase